MLGYTLFGESHGKAIGVVIMEVPPGIEVREGELTAELERRKGIRRFATKRKEGGQTRYTLGSLQGTHHGDANSPHRGEPGR